MVPLYFYVINVWNESSLSGFNDKQPSNMIEY